MGWMLRWSLCVSVCVVCGFWSGFVGCTAPQSEAQSEGGREQPGREASVEERVAGVEEKAVTESFVDAGAPEDAGASSDATEPTTDATATGCGTLLVGEDCKNDYTLCCLSQFCHKLTDQESYRCGCMTSVECPNGLKCCELDGKRLCVQNAASGAQCF